MLRRCKYHSTDGYKNYGGKGISVCEEWHDYRKFRLWALSNEYDDKLTIDRKDNSLGYSPDNCRFSTIKQQNRNSSNNHIISAFGEEKCISEWGEDPRCAVSSDTLYQRIGYGWEPERALTEASHRRMSNG
jgi:hypothetical protein